MLLQPIFVMIIIKNILTKNVGPDSNQTTQLKNRRKI